jgi:hypothetical protein
MNIKHLTLDHPLFQIATNSARNLGWNIYIRDNVNAFFRDSIVDFVLDKEDESDEDE